MIYFYKLNIKLNIFFDCNNLKSNHVIEISPPHFWHSHQCSHFPLLFWEKHENCGGVYFFLSKRLANSCLFFICFLKSHRSHFEVRKQPLCVQEHKYLLPVAPGNGTILSLKITSDNPEQQIEKPEIRVLSYHLF